MKKTCRIISCSKGRFTWQKASLEEERWGRMKQMETVSGNPAFKAEQLWMEAFGEGARLGRLEETTELKLEWDL